MEKDKHKKYVNLMCFIETCEKSRICNFKERREYYVSMSISLNFNLYNIK